MKLFRIYICTYMHLCIHIILFICILFFLTSQFLLAENHHTCCPFSLSLRTILLEFKRKMTQQASYKSWQLPEGGRLKRKRKGHAVHIKPARKSTTWWKGECQRKKKEAQGTRKSTLELWPVSERKRQKKRKSYAMPFLSQDSEKQANPTKPHVILNYARGQESCVGNIHYILIIPPITLAGFKVNPPY